ncbi:hypothetical protein CPB83DRAFT_853624 [Crepidotus variabilis]|uniref:Uncharacterized protein n=1 Tax=Crepidotus variabilis TaxID=179855 RepID=A0A9P6EHZ4_9AGAR|nr:hypothetical protein CPB83DRAFT_853624 [Crepidotus variabilis]
MTALLNLVSHLAICGRLSETGSKVSESLKFRRHQSKAANGECVGRLTLVVSRRFVSN